MIINQLYLQTKWQELLFDIPQFPPTDQLWKILAIYRVESAVFWHQNGIFLSQEMSLSKTPIWARENTTYLDEYF